MADSLKIRIDGDTSDFESSLKGLGSVARAGLAAVTAAVGAVASAMTYAASVGMEYETSLAKVNTIADTTATSLDTLSDGIMGMSSKYGIAASDLNEALYNTISAGVDTANSVEFLDQAIKLAEGGFTDTTSAVDVLTTVINAYGMEASDASKISDILIQTQNKGKTTVGELASSMGKIIPTANAYGVSLDNLAAGYAIMTANGVATAESTTYMNSMLNELGKSGMTAANNLKEATGKTFQELTASGQSLGDILTQLNDYAQKSGKSMGDMFGSAEAGKAALVLASKGADAFNESVKGMNDSVGATDAAFEKMENTTEKAMDKFKTSVQNAGIAFFDTFKEPLTEGLGEAQGAFTNLTNSLKKGKLGDSVKKLGKSVGDLIGKLGQIVAKVMPKLIDFVANLVSALPKVWKVLKQFGPAILAVVAAIKTFQAITKIATIVQAAFNAVCNANPFVFMASAVIGVVTALVTFIASENSASASTYQLTEEQEALKSTLEELNTAYSENVQQANSTAQAELAEEERLERLKEHLSDIVDEQGNVLEGHENEASFIVGELNEAYGTEISLQDGIISNYTEQMNKIDELMEKKRAEIELNRLQALAEAADGDEREKAETAFQTAKDKTTESYKKASAAASEFNEAQQLYDTLMNDIYADEGDRNVALAALIEAKRKYTDANAEWLEDLEEEKEAGKIVEQMYIDRQNYESAYADFAEGNYEKIINTVRLSGEEQVKYSNKTGEELLADLKKNVDDMSKANEEYAKAGSEWEKEYWQGRINTLTEQRQVLYNKLEEAGYYGMEGLVNGIERGDILYSKGWKIADEYIKGITDRLDEHSPSKVTEKLGKFAVEGFVIGADDTSDIYNQGENAAQSYIDALVGMATTYSIAPSFGPLVPNFNGQGIIENNYNYNTYNQDTGTHTTVLELDGEVLYQSNQKYTTLHGASLVKA